ncbi:MAG: protein tyrosine phosphatase family protein [Candidatus Aminicenantes bacterium]|nr:protein tyrosine phosphatase family protein [Candidatus Aminicenantes bacterium]
MRIIFPAALVWVVLSPGMSPAQDSEAPISARNFLWVNQEFCTAGQPTHQDLIRLKQKGIRSVLNLRTTAEDPGVAKEGAAVQALGLKYFHLPVDSSQLAPKLGDEFLRIVSDESNRPLFIHCASANRVGAFWILHRVVNQGWSRARAEEEARKIGLRSPRLLEYARKYLEQAGH